MNEFVFVQEMHDKLKELGIPVKDEVLEHVNNPDEFIEKERTELVNSVKINVRSISDLAEVIKEQIENAKSNLIPDAIIKFTLPDIIAICDAFIE